MRKAFAFLIAFSAMIGASSAHSQTVVDDWTKTDCDGNSHSLYAELDSGNIVIIDVAMTYMNGGVICGPCRAATTALQNIHAQYEASHPGKVRHYALAYNDTQAPYDCDLMEQWKDECGFTVPTFVDCAEITSLYGTGMPVVVVVGPNHSVLKKFTGWSANGSPSNEAAIKTAIDKALASASVNEPTPKAVAVRIASEGSEQRLEFDLEHSSTLSIDVIDVLGKSCGTLAESTMFSEGSHKLALPTANLSSGKYIIRVTGTGGMNVTVPFNVTH